MRVFVTGGTGVVGTAAVRSLVAHGHEVRLCSRNAERDVERWPRGVQACPGSVDDPASIRGYARGVKGFWLMLAAAVDPRLSRIWLDRTPISMRTAFENPLASFLFDAMIPSFARHWEFSDLEKAIGARRILRTDPANWMNQVVAAEVATRL